MTAGSGIVLGESTNNNRWFSEHFQDHQLIGKVWSSREKVFISPEQLSIRLKSARFVLLGEIHTNKDHHLLQAKYLAEIAGSAKSSPRLVVEMIPKRYGPILNKFRKAKPKQTQELGGVLEWEKRGWGEWANYKPIFDVAYRLNLDILPGNLDRKDTRKIGTKGVKALNNKETTELSLDVPYTKTQSKLLTDMLFDSHCKFVPRAALSPMQLVQQARDGFMAGAMLAAPSGSAAVLIAGSGHIRRDWAVPRILAARDPDSKIVSVSFTEVTPDNKKPQDYEPESADNNPVFDYLYFTPKSEIKDHCAELAKRFKKHKSK